jgi:hypothetical protein
VCVCVCVCGCMYVNIYKYKTKNSVVLTSQYTAPFFQYLFKYLESQFLSVIFYQCEAESSLLWREFPSCRCSSLGLWHRLRSLVGRYKREGGTYCLLLQPQICVFKTVILKWKRRYVLKCPCLCDSPKHSVLVKLRSVLCDNILLDCRVLL